MRTWIVLASLFLPGLFPFPSEASPVPLSTCGEVIADATLTSDIDCSDASGFAVIIEDGGSLDLAGHRIIGTRSGEVVDAPAVGGGILCKGSCTIAGDGSVEAPAGLQEGRYPVGLYQPPYGVKRKQIMRIQDVRVSGWLGLGAVGVLGGNVAISGSQITDNSTGLSVTRPQIANCSFENNEIGAHLWAGSVDASEFAGNSRAALSSEKRVKLSDSTLSGNGTVGYYGGKLLARDSTISGNCTTPVGTAHCADIVTRSSTQYPRIDRASCGTSWQREPDKSWNLCSLD